MNTQKEILQVERLTKVYGKGDSKTEALKGITFSCTGRRILRHYGCQWLRQNYIA